MIISLPQGKREYVCKADRDLEPSMQTVFLLDDLKEKDRVAIMDSLVITMGGDAQMGGTGTRVYTCLKAGLRGWRNLRDVDTSQIECRMKGDQISDESLALLPWEVKIELQEELLNGAFMTEADKEK